VAILSPEVEILDSVETSDSLKEIAFLRVSTTL